MLQKLYFHPESTSLEFQKPLTIGAPRVHRRFNTEAVCTTGHDRACTMVHVQLLLYMYKHYMSTKTVPKLHIYICISLSLLHSCCW